jgi:hypothetical protein
MEACCLRRILFLWLLLWFAALPASGSQAIDPVDPPEAWQPVFERLRVTLPMTVEFTEARRNPFHRMARQFRGTVRWDPQLGLSIQYHEPTEMTIWIAADGLVIVRGGKVMQTELGRDHAELMQLFARIFAWDTAWLGERFRFDGEMADAGDWQLDLQVKDVGLKASLSAISLVGDAAALREIGLNLSGGRTARMTLADAVFSEAFSPEARAQAFPQSNDE